MTLLHCGGVTRGVWRRAWMKVLVLGGGVIGVSAAYQLALVGPRGHRPSIASRRPGLETSYANAGEVSPGDPVPWGGPGVPLKAVKWLLMRHRPLVIRANVDWDLVRWALAKLRNCTAARYAVNKRRMVRLAEYSRDCLSDTARADRHPATTGACRARCSCSGPRSSSTAVRPTSPSSGRATSITPCSTAPAASARSRRWRAVREKFVGGLLLPGDETGDCFKFTQRLAALAAARGVAFRYGTLDPLRAGARRRIEGVDDPPRAAQADAVLVALGSYSPLLLRPLGLRLPVYPVKGYSLTVPIVDASHRAGVDRDGRDPQGRGTRLGDRIRVGGTAELAGYTLQAARGAARDPEYVVTHLFGGAGDLGRAEFWCGLRPMTPDGTPVVGPTPIRGPFLATGHGTLGWTMAVGTARFIADVISPAEPEIELEGLTIDRYLGAA